MERETGKKYTGDYDETATRVIAMLSNLKSAQAGYPRNRTGEFYIELITQYFLFGYFRFDLTKFAGYPIGEYQIKIAHARNLIDLGMKAAIGEIFVL